MADHATIDFETRSACDIRKHGAYLYALHPTTEVMCLAYKLPGYDSWRLWHMAHPNHGLEESKPPHDLLEYVEDGGIVEAHNAFFEQVIWWFHMVKKRGWPPVKKTGWRCSAAKASASALPRSLGGACAAMGLPFDLQKDKDGRKIMLKLSKPRAPSKAEIVAWMESQELTGDYRRYKKAFTESNGPLWHEDLGDLKKLWAYCGQDVVSEEALSAVVPDLSPQELRVWQIDQQMNWRGVRFDLPMARAALSMADAYKAELNAELKELTGIESATRRQAVLEWLAKHESLDLPDTQAQTLEWFIKNADMSGRARRVCEIVTSVNKTSTRKYQSMLNMADADDWRARDHLMYHGASTGRYSGKGVQIQNFKARDLIVKDFEEAADDIKSKDMTWCSIAYDDVMTLLSDSLRGAIIPDPNRRFAVADYSAIEARCVLWLASATDALNVFYDGGDIYCDMASHIYGFDVNKKDNPHERQFGKQAVLGLGYGMGFVTFLITCRSYNITFSIDEVVRILGKEKFVKYRDWVRSHLCLDAPPDWVWDDPDETKKYKERKRAAAKVIRRLKEHRENVNDIIHELALMKYTVDVYRNRYAEVKQLWKDQEEAAISAVSQWENEIFPDEGPRVPCGMVTWFVRDNFLCCELPSGRLLRYRDPEVKSVKTAWGEVKQGLRYMSINGTTKKWERTATYGGKIVENITQAVARDIMVEALLRIVDFGIYDPVMSVHDELVSEFDAGDGSCEEYEELMSIVPPWAQGCPIDAEAEVLTRYKK